MQSNVKVTSADGRQLTIPVQARTGSQLAIADRQVRDHAATVDAATLVSDFDATDSVDFEIENHGSIFLFRPTNEAALDHLREHVDIGAQWLCGALAVEHRYARDLAVNLTEAGWSVA